jgi:hypothetical protein
MPTRRRRPELRDPIRSSARLGAGEAYKAVVKLTFAHGASLPDPARLFNSSLEGKTRRAIDLCEGQKVDARALKALVKAAVARNVATAKKKWKGTKRASSSRSRRRAARHCASVRAARRARV